MQGLSHPKYRPDIDGLRAVAVLSVLFFHAFPEWVGGGFIGVDVFFVISGYLISIIIFENLNEKRFSFFEFYSRRINRIFPALIFVLIFCYGFGWLNLLADDFAQLGKHIAGGAGFIANLVLWSESGYFDKAAELKPLLHLWSLGIEEQFYFIWPLFVWVVVRWPKKLLKLTLAITLISFIANALMIFSNPVATFYSPLTRFWELLIGALLAYGFVYQPVLPFTLTKAHLNKLSATGLLLILLTVILVSQKSAFPGWWALMPTIGAALIIGSGSSAWCNQKILSNKLLVWFGLISFPLYLWHWPILAFARLQEGETPSIFVRSTLVLVSIILAWLTYRFVERPIRFNASHRTHKNIALIFLMILIGYLGFNCFDRKGLQQRHKRFIGEMSGYSFDKVRVQRQNTCFLMGKEGGAKNFAEDCTHQDRPYKLALWGDSQGASMYPGFNWLEQVDSRVAVSQYTIAGCGGLVATKDQEQFCQDANQEALNSILKLKPNLVVLYKGWHNGYYKNLVKTIELLRENGMSVLVLGNSPRWNEDLPRILYRYWKKNREFPPEFSTLGLDLGSKKISDDLGLIVKKNHGIYYPVYDKLCNFDGCMVRVPGDLNPLVTLDEDHITPAAAVYIVQDVYERILKDLIDKYYRNSNLKN